MFLANNLEIFSSDYAHYNVAFLAWNQRPQEKYEHIFVGKRKEL